MNKNIGGMLKGIQQLQSRMEKIQTELSQAVYNGDAGGGVVHVTVTGKGELKSLKLNPSLMSESVEVLEDLVIAAMNVAHTRKEAAAKEKLGDIASGALPFGMKIPGLG